MKSPVVTARELSVREKRSDMLRANFLETVDALRRRRADLVAEDLIEHYVTLDWLEWAGGTLRLTTTGTNICKQLQPRPT